ncbi:MAG: ABC transporter ATP-binding protein [Erysipelotrichaceae bacterium]|nr:ABC transporter ATP-binding protein [Erysipelotrichaceae bacterium]
MIKVQDLSFSYTRKPFIEHLNFTVGEGEIFGFLGPSGAGKSTLQKILVGIISEYTGNVTVNNVDLRQHQANFYETIGVDFEFPTLYEKLTGRQNLLFFASLYQHHLDIAELFAMVDLTEAIDQPVQAYSKGMKTRLNFIKALVHDPQTIFLDEPLSGLDPNNARRMKEIILKLKTRGKTIILTTHNMYDASELCDRVAFIVKGSIKALDTPPNLIIKGRRLKLNYTFRQAEQDQQRSTMIDETADDEILLNLLRQNRLITIHSDEPTLNDVFVSLTGSNLQ